MNKHKENDPYEIPDTVTYSEIEFVDCTESSQSDDQKNRPVNLPTGQPNVQQKVDQPIAGQPTVPQPAGQPAGQPTVPQPIGKLALQNASGLYARRNMIVDGSFNAKM